MNNDNTVKIGVALKWRNTFDTTKRYYQENVVTACGCVFRCKVLQAQGKSPIRFTDEQGHIAYTNTDVWDVLVDMAYYYNYTVDTRKLTQEMLDYAKKLDEAFQKQQKEIAALQKDNKDQWDHIKDIEKTNAEQQRELNSIHDTISCFSEGIWIDTLLWSDVTIWDNNKYAITDDLQDQINVLTENHNQDIEDLIDKHNSELNALTTSIINQNKIQDGINNYLQDQIYDLNNGLCCFGSGVWENDLHWSQEALWDNNKYAITDALAEELETLTTNHNKDVKNINAHLLASDQEFAKAVLQNASEHRLVNDRLNTHDDEIEALQTLIKEHDNQILDLLETLTCYSYGQWDDGLKWGNSALWDNSNQMCDTFDDLYQKIADHQKAIDELVKRITEIKLESPTAQIEALEQKIITENRKTAYQIRAIGREQTIQNIDIARLGEHFCCFSDGSWGDLFVWDNALKWANQPGIVVEALEDIRSDASDLRQKLEKANEDIRISLSLIQVNSQLIENNRASIQSNSEEIQSNQQRLIETQKVHEEDVERLRNEALTEHRSVAYQFRAIAREQKAQDENVTKIGEHFSCYADGVWGNLFIWDNHLKWANQSGVVNDALEELRSNLWNTNQKIEDANEDIITNLNLIRADHQLIEGNIDAIEKNKESIAENQKNHDTDVKTLRNEALTEHRQVAYRLREISREQTLQNDEIAKLGEHFNCFADGVWCNLFLWENDRFWANESGVVIHALEDIHGELDSHQAMLNLIIEEKDEHFSCFNDDIWCNSSVWDNGRLWPTDFSNFTQAIQKNEDDIKAVKESVKTLATQTEKEIATIADDLSQKSEQISEISTSIQSHQSSIEENTQKINDNTENIQNLNKSVDNFQTQAINEHIQIAYQLRAIEREQVAQDENLAKLGEHFGCFVDGKWCDLFLWNNGHLWHNETGFTEEAIADTNERIDSINNEIDNINHRAEEHQSEYQEMLDDIRSYNGCFEKGEWANPFFWNDTDKWYNSPDVVSETEAEIISHDHRLTALESQFSLFLQQFAVQQTIIEQQQTQLETFMDCFTVLNVGKWQNLLLWDNTSKWSNALITEATASVGTGGASTVTVKSYDPDTATVTI